MVVALFACLKIAWQRIYKKTDNKVVCANRLAVVVVVVKNNSISPP